MKNSIVALAFLISSVGFAAVDNTKLNGDPSPLAIEKIDADLLNLKAMMNETSSDKESQEILSAKIEDLQKAHDDLAKSVVE